MMECAPDQDSRDENIWTVDNLTGNQFRASAEVVSFHTDGEVHRTGGFDTSEYEQNADYVEL